MRAFAINQSRYDVAERGEGLVDLAGFLQTHPCGTSLALALRSLVTNYKRQVFRLQSYLTKLNYKYCLLLFNDAITSKDCIVSNDRVIGEFKRNWKEKSWPNLRHYHCICLERLS